MSFNIATTGLNAITEQLNSISNNIANSGTIGYKSMRAEFSAMYADSQAMGVNVSKVSQSITRGGSIQASASNLDLAISGNGFFVMRDSDGNTTYSRAGYMTTDTNGYLNQNGMKLQGYPVDANGVLQVGTVTDLQVKSGSIPAKATDELDFAANLDARAEKPERDVFDPADAKSYNNTYTTQVYDSLGREHSLSQYFVKKDDNTWEAYYYMDGEPLNGGAPTEMTFTEQGVLQTPSDKVNLQADIGGAAGLSIDLDYSGTSQYGSEFSVSKNKATGYSAGEKTGEQIDADGSVYATYSNGQRMLQGQLVLASFSNPNGLASTSGTAWTSTSESGTALLAAAGAGLNGTIKSGALEGSNVDLTNELVGLMTAQRNYQANTKVISTNDSMMNALFQAL
ncbi:MULTISPECIES: flagellar hook protein FlgE [Rahnella]|uniref:Flagellar hook protein FlgE n=1 Tax=Rahnella laticis TaxID=2787622 RepID=A0ABS0E382_9GAMM|nr:MULTISPECIES: flagellar hook protein FlgE [Rahnella]MBF7978465.1 flagellar basal body protein FlgE [Rahnella laticis]MBF7995250.1 flagellar basal body protein FlgE [Rahnella laticis]MBF7998555.1 flagellar basal body protein FlgE [Rahnella sp. LAC-M12]